jgi:hypothetical protein
MISSNADLIAVVLRLKVRQVSLFHRLLHAGEAGKTERVVLVQDSDSGNTKIIGQVLDPGLGLLKIRGANIDHVAVERIAEKFRARERTDEGHLGGSRDWLAGFRRRRSHSAHQRENLVVIDCLVRGFDGLFGLVAVVNRLELELAAINAAGPVGFLKCCKNTLAHSLAQRLRRAIERRDLSEEDAVFGYAVFRVAVRIQTTCERCSKQAEPATIGPHRKFPPAVARVR